jgi:hypothetical protein
MSVTPQPPNLLKTLEEIKQRLKGLEQNQNWGIRDGKGIQRLFAGRQPTSGLYNLAAFDSSGNVRLLIGGLPNGDSGAMVFDPATGASQEIWPAMTVEIDTLEATSSTSYTDLATVGPTVTAEVYATGNVLVTASSYLSTPGAASSINGSYVGVSVDGGAAIDLLQLQLSTPAGAAVGAAAQFSRQKEITGLSAGLHTFKLKYKALGGSSSFETRVLTVQPL